MSSPAAERFLTTSLTCLCLARKQFCNSRPLQDAAGSVLSNQTPFSCRLRRWLAPGSDFRKNAPDSYYRRFAREDMMTNEERFLAALGTFAEVAGSVELDEVLANQCDEFVTRIGGFRVLVPVVGSFNAGKTSLINAYLQREEGEGLPTAIVPQTALATEIHLSREGEPECVELLDDKDQVLNRLGLADFGRYEKQAETEPHEDPHFAKAYLQAESPTAASRIVLVDMPGLDSGLRNHNAAIQRYLPLGSHFMLVVDIDRGSLRESEMIQLREFLGREIEFTVFANKADRKRHESSAVVAHIEKQVFDAFGKSVPVSAVSARDGEIGPFATAFQSIDPDVALRNFWRARLLSLFDQAITSLHTRYSAINVTSAEAEGVVERLEGRRIELEEKLAEDERDIRGRYSERATERILREVRDDIRSSADKLVAAYERGGYGAFEEQLNELVRSTLNRTLETAGSETHQDIVMRYRTNIEGLDAELGQLVVDGAAAVGARDLQDIGRTFKHASAESFRVFSAAAERAAKAERAADSMRKSKSVITVAAGVFGIMTSVVAPWLEAMLVLAPWMIGLFSRGAQELEQRAELHRQITNVIAPKVASELRPQVADDYARIVGELLSGLRSNIHEQIEQVQRDIHVSREDIEAGRKDADAQRSRLAEAIGTLTDERSKIEVA